MRSLFLRRSSSPSRQVFQDLGQGHHVGIFLVHVKKIDGMGGFMAVKDAFFNHDHPIPIGAPIDHTGANTTTSAFTTRDDRVNLQVLEVSHQWGTPEGAGRGFPQHGFARKGSDFVNNIPLAFLALTSVRAEVSGR
jgi:hypothetical protein